MPTYKDLDLSLRMHPITGDLLTLTDDEAIKQSVKTLILTGLYERSMHPEIGCQVHGLLFELNNIFTHMTMQQTILDILTTHEPRILVQDVLINDDDDNNGLIIEIHYKILTYRKDASVSLLLNRIR